jgi:hypothetical protein
MYLKRIRVPGDIFHAHHTVGALGRRSAPLWAAQLSGARQGIYDDRDVTKRSDALALCQ